MRTFLVSALLLIAGCKESGSSLATVRAFACESVDSGVSDIYQTPTADLVRDATSTVAGFCVAFQGDYVWVRDADQPDYHYAVNALDGSLRESAGLVFLDAACVDLVGEVFDYPLHLSGDVYVFAFEGGVYEYPLAGFFGVSPGTYYFRAPGGACEVFAGDPATVREVQPSAFAKTFSGPLTIE